MTQNERAVRDTRDKAGAKQPPSGAGQATRPAAKPALNTAIKAADKQARPAKRQPAEAGGERREASASAPARKRGASKAAAASRKKKKQERRFPWKALIAVGIACLILDAILIFSWPKRAPQVQVITAYMDEIRAAAGEWELDPAYAASVVMAESSYRPDAVSSVNAQGLMQIVPETGDWIAGRLGETYVEGQLLDPATNLRYGCWYLKWLMDRYADDMATASAAYFQGQGVVDRWLMDPLLSQDRKKLTDFGTEATKTYVERILKYYERYSEIYSAA